VRGTYVVETQVKEAAGRAALVINKNKTKYMNINRTTTN